MIKEYNGKVGLNDLYVQKYLYERMARSMGKTISTIIKEGIVGILTESPEKRNGHPYMAHHELLNRLADGGQGITSNTEFIDDFDDSLEELLDSDVIRYMKDHKVKHNCGYILIGEQSK